MFFQMSKQTTAIGYQIVRDALQELGPRGLTENDFSLTLLVHDRNGVGLPEGFAHRGDAMFYPCSIIKIFYLVAAQAALEAGHIEAAAELDRAMHDMIKWSSNTATNYVIDVVSGTTGDTDLHAEDMRAWRERRYGINTYLQSLGLTEFAGINVSQKLMDDDRYGREKAFVQLGGNNHNRLTSNAAASMLARIMTAKMVSPARSKVMADLLQRPRTPEFLQTPGAQVLNYLGQAMAEDATIWSKAGWTGWTRDPQASYRRHDVIHVDSPGAAPFTLAVFTQGQQISTDMGMLPFIGARAAALLAR